jgi:hypothetical protein
MKKTEAPTDDNSQIGTVGCVAIDAVGNLATATSTGGLVNKMVGRIGDTPVVGAGTYANALCAVSATGKGETIIRHTVARDVAALMEHRGLPLSEAAATSGSSPSRPPGRCVWCTTPPACSGRAPPRTGTPRSASGRTLTPRVTVSALGCEVIVHSRDIVSCVCMRVKFVCLGNWKTTYVDLVVI